MTSLQHDVLLDNHDLMFEFRETESYKKRVNANEAYAKAYNKAFEEVNTAIDRCLAFTDYFLAIPDKKIVQKFESTNCIEVPIWIYNLNPKMWTGRIDAKHNMAYIGFNGLKSSLHNLAKSSAYHDIDMPYDLFNQTTVELDIKLYSEEIQLIHKNLQSVTGGYMADIMSDLNILHGIDSAWDLKTLLGLSKRLGIKGTWQSTST